MHWNATKGATSYGVIIPYRNSQTKVVIHVAETKADITGLTPHKAYDLKVIAINQSGATLSDAYGVWAPPPKHWWGHQADHTVKFEIDSAMSNNYIKNSVAAAAGAWNKATKSLDKGLQICIACNDDNFTVTVKTVNNKNNARGDANHKPNEGCGGSYACVKQDGPGGENTSPHARPAHGEYVHGLGRPAHIGCTGPSCNWALGKISIGSGPTTRVFTTQK